MFKKTVKDTKALAAAGNYSAKDVLSESATVGTIWTFDKTGGGGYIVKAIAICETHAVVMRITLLLFKATPSTSNVLNDNVASTTLLEADWDNFIGAINFPALFSYNGDGFAVAIPGEGCKLPLSFNSPDGKLYGIVITEDAETGEVATDNLTIYLELEPN